MNTKKTLFNWEGGQTLKQGAQGGCVVSTPADIQNSAGHSPGQPALADLARAQGMDKMISTSSFQHQLFSDSVSCFLYPFLVIWQQAG